MPSPEEQIPLKSSMEILSELFSTFNAEPPVIVKKEKDELKKHKKTKKKHKHKDKKHKKKSKKRKHSPGGSSNSEIDLAEILIKNERQSPEKKIKLEIENNGEIKSDNIPTDINEDITTENTALSADEAKVKAESHLENVDKQKKKEKHKRKHKHRDKKSKSRSRSREHSSPKHSKSRDKPKEACKDKHRDGKHKHDRHREYKDQERELKIESKLKEKDYDDFRSYKTREDNSFYKDEERFSDDDKFFFRERYKLYHMKEKEKRHRERSVSSDRSANHIDKKKLLEIARKNAIQMMKSGSLPGALNLGPQAQEKVLAAIKSGGKTIEELTDFCKSLSKQEEIGELSSISDENGSDSENDMPFHHPFQIKERPSSITMNIKNSVPLPLKTTQERASELRMQFPVSSGQQHRRTENEWVPVSPKKTESAPQPVVKIPEPSSSVETVAAPVVQETPAPVAPGPQVFPPLNETAEKLGIDIASIVSQRLTAMRKLQENPNDSQAICEMHRAQKKVNTWAESKQQIGQFTGSTGAQILTQAELNAGYQAWARKDQLQTAAPVSGGMGMHLLQKMGWKPGEGLGKEKTGALEPLLLEVKLDKKGIVAKEEQKRKQAKPVKGVTKINIQGKHPVSLLGEFASKQKLGAPQYSLCFECGPDHKKNFLFKVLINGIEYKPNVASPNKKEAKANAASVCLQQLGLLPSCSTT